MSKKDLKGDFEENRQEIEMEDERVDDLPSRSAVHRRGKKKKGSASNTIINIFLVLFTLIPLGIITYIAID